ncbi:hypothetical protein Tco_1305920, partial [Tanacetum coccineum]
DLNNMYMLVVAKTCRGEPVHMVAHASEWNVEGRLPLIVTGLNVNTIIWMLVCVIPMSMMEDDGSCNNVAAIMEMDQPGITYPMVLGRMNVAVKSKQGYNGSNSENIGTGLVDKYSSLSHDH